MRFVIPALAAACAPIAGAHNHVTVDTFVGPLGPTAIVDAGYLANESAYSIGLDRRLLLDGEPVVYELSQMAASGPFEGWFTLNASLLTLTSDFHYITGRLGSGYNPATFSYANPGQFVFDIVGVEAVSGPGAVFAHGGGSDTGRSDGVDVNATSYFVGAGNHEHSQRMYLSAGGVYDVTLRVRDLSGQFVSDEPGGLSDLIVRVSAPLEACAADLNANGVADPGDFTAWISAYNAGDLRADNNGNGALDAGDFTAWISDYNGGCP